MLTHLLKLIWNKKKQNFLLIMEMFVSFLVMFAVFTLVVYYYHNYRKPMGFKYEDVWAITYNIPETSENTRGDSVAMRQESIKQVLQSIPEIEHITFTSSNIPFSFSR